MQEIALEDLKIVDEKVKKVYKYGIHSEHIPETYKDRFYRAAYRFSRQNINYSKMGLAEEIGDLTYQVLKALLIGRNLLTLTDQKRLYEKHNEDWQDLTISQLYDEAYALVQDSHVRQVMSYFPSEIFPSSSRIAKDFIANQYVAYLSRIVRVPHNTSWAYHTIDFVKNKKIPEEIAELVEIINKQQEVISGDDMLKSLKRNLTDSRRFVYLTSDFVKKDNFLELFEYSNSFIKKRLKDNLGLQDILDFCLFKIRGRQELTFKGYEHKAVMHIAKPIEYLIEADLVH
jgi:hypothetical protein